MKTFKQYLAKMKTLYVMRPVLNGAAIRKWFKSQGINDMVPEDDLHVTIAFSKKSVDWNKIRFKATEVSVGNGKRTVAPLGDKGALVLKFDSAELHHEWQQFRDSGCSWDYDSGYIPHMTITYDAKGLDPKKIKPYTGKILLGGQSHKEVDDNWANKLKED